MKRPTTKYRDMIRRVSLLVAGIIFMLPGKGISQVFPPPGNPGPGGGTPDPLGEVPFDWRLNLLLLLAGTVLAVVVIVKIKKNKALRKSVV
jgi:hypothetical protein